jgi:putative CocE/NonD family hydrolase
MSTVGGARSEPLREVREIEHCWIPLSDGERLAARIWLPEDAEEDPVPAILEYVPYRKGDGTALDDSLRQPWLAARGYAAVRADLRGSGESDGILYDEYLPREQQDALELIAWLAAQPWCDGRVGLWGISWGGFNALQIAARRPPALRAIVTVCSTDDRYSDDVHYVGGCLQAHDALAWPTTMHAFSVRPPDPHLVGESWRRTWLERLERTPPYIEAWLAHQRRDAYWRQGSVCEDYAAIACPVYAVGGWEDGYTNAVLRLLEGLSVPRRGLIGPWAHIWPHVGRPGPAVGFLQECLRWWDHWLRQRDTGVMEEPMLRVWMQESVAPAARHRERPGRWVCERSWPPDGERLATRSLCLNPDGLAPDATPERELCIATDLAHGSEAGVWCSSGAEGDAPRDQRDEDARCLCFDAAPAREREEILGNPTLTLALRADRPRAQVVVRLCDVAPDGASLLVTRGLLNLTHRDGHETPLPLDPGRLYRVRVRLDAIAHALPPGHYWRVAVAPAYWPIAWPSPEPVTLRLLAGEACRLDLPLRRARPGDARLPDLPPPEMAPALALEVLRRPDRSLRRYDDPETGRRLLERSADYGRLRLEGSGMELGGESRDRYGVSAGDPLSAEVRCERRLELARGDWHTRIETESSLRASETHLHVSAHLRALEGEAPLFERSWTFRIPRDHL